MPINDLYKHSLALLTDLYQLTMAYGYWKHGLAEREAVFHLTYRKNPFGGGYAITCGLAQVIEWLEEFRFDEDDTQYLATLTGNDSKPLFANEFLDYLLDLRFSCDVDAIAEGTVVFPHEPLIRVQGPLLQCQILETGLLNIINFQSLIATKASRVCASSRGDSVLEFGLRRAQGIDGGLSASRAAYIGGCSATSNVLAGKLFDIPVKGTHAHSWVMAFDDERHAFSAYADAMPHNCTLLIDTYDSISGIKNAIEIGLHLREQGHKLIGIRLDSGDLTELSITARQLLDEAGLAEAVIVASNDLDEHSIAKCKESGAKINVWGVGTRMVTAFDQPALGGVYKLSAIEDGGQWKYRVKTSDDPVKVSNPGIQQVRRFFNESEFVRDVIFDETMGCVDQSMLAGDSARKQEDLPARFDYLDLLEPVFRRGRLVGETPETASVRERSMEELIMLPAKCRKLSNPATYQVGIDSQLLQLKMTLMSEVSRSET